MKGLIFLVCSSVQMFYAIMILWHKLLTVISAVAQCLLGYLKWKNSRKLFFNPVYCSSISQLPLQFSELYTGTLIQAGISIYISALLENTGEGCHMAITSQSTSLCTKQMLAGGSEPRLLLLRLPLFFSELSCTKQTNKQKIFCSCLGFCLMYFFFSIPTLSPALFF